MSAEQCDAPERPAVELTSGGRIAGRSPLETIAAAGPDGQVSINCAI